MHGDREIGILICVIIIIFSIGIYLTYIDEQDWQKFKQQYNCKVSAHIEGTLTHRNVTCSICDNGITYYRND